MLRNRLAVALGILILCLVFGAVALSQAQYVVYSWETSLPSGTDTVVVFLQNGSSWYNQTIRKEGPKPATQLVKRFVGLVDVLHVIKVPFNDYEVQYDEATGETTVTFFDPPGPIKKGDEVRVCIFLEQSNAQMRKEYWVAENDEQAALPTPGWSFEDQRLTVVNAGDDPVEVWNFRMSTVVEPLTLEDLSEEGLRQRGVILEQIRFPRTTIPPGGQIAIPPPTERVPFGQWGLIALGILLAVALAIVITRRLAAQGSHA